jgi:hypothetical protein
VAIVVSCMPALSLVLRRCWTKTKSHTSSLKEVYQPYIHRSKESSTSDYSHPSEKVVKKKRGAWQGFTDVIATRPSSEGERPLFGSDSDSSRGVSSKGFEVSPLSTMTSEKGHMDVSPMTTMNGGEEEPMPRAHHRHEPAARTPRSPRFPRIPRIPKIPRRHDPMPQFHHGNRCERCEEQLAGLAPPKMATDKRFSSTKTI